jgi:hypothetical protein
LRVEPNLLFAIGQDDNGTLMSLGDKFGQLSLGFSNGQCFHVANISQSVPVNKLKRSGGWRAGAHPLLCVLGSAEASPYRALGRATLQRSLRPCGGQKRICAPGAPWFSRFSILGAISVPKPRHWA